MFSCICAYTKFPVSACSLSFLISSIPFAASKVIVIINIKTSSTEEVKKIQFQHSSRYISKILIYDRERSYEELNVCLIELKRISEQCKNAELCNLTFMREIFFMEFFCENSKEEFILTLLTFSRTSRFIMKRDFD